MARTAVILVALALGACQSPQQQRILQSLTPAQRAQCETQARMGGMHPNAFIAGADMAAIRGSCQETAIYTNMEALGQALGFRLEGGRQLTKNQRAMVGGFAEQCGMQPTTIAAFRARFAGPDVEEDWQRGRAAERGASIAACQAGRLLVDIGVTQPR